jgi:MoaA/NifB/PqqE/SkfB family radical SAM enzyme
MNYFPESVVFLLTDRCNAGCSFCGIERSDTYHDLPLEVIFDCINQSHELGVRRIAFSGGEPFIRYGDMLKCMKYAKSKGLKSIVTTNACYARSEENGLKITKELKEAGLTQIAVSFDIDHLRHVPYSSCLNAIEAALSNDLKITIITTNIESTKSENELLLQKLANDLGSKPDENNIWIKNGRKIVVQQRFATPLGEARKLDYNEFRLREMEDSLASCEADGLTVKSNGDIVPCCNFPAVTNDVYVVGNARNTRLKTAIKKIDESIIGSLLLPPLGLDRIKAFLKNSSNHHFRSMASGKYASKCEFCSKVLSDPLSRETIVSEHYKFSHCKPESFSFKEPGTMAVDNIQVTIGNKKMDLIDYLGAIPTEEFYLCLYRNFLCSLEQMEARIRPGFLENEIMLVKREIESLSREKS